MQLFIDSVADYEMVQIPAVLVNFSSTDENGMTVTVRKDGDYRFVIRRHRRAGASFTSGIRLAKRRFRRMTALP